jgi:hypothetical protein
VRGMARTRITSRRKFVKAVATGLEILPVVIVQGLCYDSAYYPARKQPGPGSLYI